MDGAACVHIDNIHIDVSCPCKAVARWYGNVRPSNMLQLKLRVDAGTIAPVI